MRWSEHCPPAVPFPYRRADVFGPERGLQRQTGTEDIRRQCGCSQSRAASESGRPGSFAVRSGRVRRLVLRDPGQKDGPAVHQGEHSQIPPYGFFHILPAYGHPKENLLYASLGQIFDEITGHVYRIFGGSVRRGIGQIQIF